MKANAGKRPPTVVDTDPHYPFSEMWVAVEVYEDGINGADDVLIHSYETDLSDKMKRRVFAEQMSEAYAAGQYSVVAPVRVKRKTK